MDVDIWSDIACPWCYIGKRHLESALEGFEHRDQVTVRWHSFELDPQAPAERDGEAASNLARKYGTSREQAVAMLDKMTATAAEDGLEFHLERARSGNTFDGHRLIHLALEHGRQDAMKERLMRAYLTEGELHLRPRDAAPPRDRGRAARRRRRRTARRERVRAGGAHRRVHGQPSGYKRGAVLRGRPNLRVGRRAARRAAGGDAAARLGCPLCCRGIRAGGGQLLARGLLTRRRCCAPLVHGPTASLRP